jgi:hypothetical protein
MGWLRKRRKATHARDDILDGELLVLADESGALTTVTDEDGDEYVVAFTSKASLHEFVPDASHVPFAGRSALSLLLETDYPALIVDPGGDDVVVIPRATAEELVGVSRDALWSGPTILFAAPDDELPPEFVARLQGICERDTNVAFAYLFLAASPGQEAPPQLVLGLELVSGNELSDDFVSAAFESEGSIDEIIGTYASLDVQVLEDSLLELARAHGMRIYAREGA